MKASYMAVFTAAVIAKVNAANGLGTKTTWSTKDHLDTLAKVIEANPTQVRDVLGECYNVSAFQQTLAKMFKSTGHFQRETVGATLNHEVSELEKFAAAHG